MEKSDQIQCPKCNSSQLSANKKGFSGRKAFAGAVLTGGIGLLAGTIGSNDIIITCLDCGNEFGPGEQHNQEPTKLQWQTFSNVEKRTPKQIRTRLIIVRIVFIALSILLGLPGILSLIVSGYSITGLVLVLLAGFFVLAACMKPKVKTE